MRSVLCERRSHYCRRYAAVCVQSCLLLEFKEQTRTRLFIFSAFSFFLSLLSPAGLLQSGDTALIAAAANGHTTVVSTLLSSKAEVDAANKVHVRDVCCRR